jgi:hypothetical protein
MSRSTHQLMLWSRWTWCMRMQKTWSWKCHQTIRRWLYMMQLIEGFNGEGLLLILTHQQQFQHRPLLVSRITLLVRYFLRHNLTRWSHVYLQFKSNHVRLNLGFGVPRSLHLIRHNPLLLCQRWRRMCVPRVNHSRSHPRQQRASNHLSRQLWWMLTRSMKGVSPC